MKIMQSYYFWKNDVKSLTPFANLIVGHSNNPNHLANAYYCLLLEAEENSDIEKLSQYSHARTDALNLLRDNTMKYTEAIPILEEYLINPFQWYWVWIVLTSIVVVFPFLAVGIWGYYRRTRFTFRRFVNYLLV